MPKPLTITSTNNAHALAVYAALSILGGVYTFTDAPPSVLSVLPENVATTLMGAMMFGGIACFSASLISARQRDPTMSMSVEIAALTIVSISLAVFLYSLIQFYGGAAPAPAAIVFVGSCLAGCVGRALQAAWERRLLTRARHQRDRRTVEVTAEPDRM